MARAPKVTKVVDGTRDGLRKREKIEYNVQKLSDQSILPLVTEIYVAKKKPATPKKKGGKKVKKSGATYLVLIKRALKDVDAPGFGLESIVKWLATNYPDKTNRRNIRLALTSGVDRKVFVKTRASWRLSKKAQENMHRSDPKKKATKKKTTTSKKGTTKKATTKKTTTTKKSTTKKATTTKKETTKKAPASKREKETTKKSTTSKKRASEDDAPKSPKKKVIGPPPTDESGAVSEAIGQWQYYDGGWQNYTDDGSRIVEGVFQEYKFQPEIHVRPVQSGHFSYSVNFHTMEQTNTTTNTMRKIKRI